MNTTRIIQIIVSLVALMAVAAHLRWPDLNIDAITVSLLALAFIPWLGAVFKSVELNWLGKVEYQDFERLGSEAKNAGLIDQSLESSYSFELTSDPNLALAGMRIELERILRTLVDSLGVKTMRTVDQYFGVLASRNLLSGQEVRVLVELIPLLNQAVHGAAVDERTVRWVLTTGKQILIGLDARIASSESAAR